MDKNKKAAVNKKVLHVLKFVVLVLVLCMFIFPFYMVLINVFKTKADITSNPLAVIGAHGFTLKNFPEAIKKMNFMRAFGNSLFITVLSTVLTILFSSMTAYIMVRRKWKITGILFALMIASMGHSLSGIDDPSGILLRRHLKYLKPQSNPDLHAYRVFPFHGDLYVPWCDQH